MFRKQLSLIRPTLFATLRIRDVSQWVKHARFFSFLPPSLPPSFPPSKYSIEALEGNTRTPYSVKVRLKGKTVFAVTGKMFFEMCPSAFIIFGVKSIWQIIFARQIFHKCLSPSPSNCLSASQAVATGNSLWKCWPSKSPAIIGQNKCMFHCQ